MKAYLAAPFFSQNERYIYDRAIDYLRNACHYDLYTPKSIPLKTHGTFPMPPGAAPFSTRMCGHWMKSTLCMY